MKNVLSIVFIFCFQIIGAADLKNNTELVSNKYFYRKVEMFNVTDKIVAAQVANTFTLENIREAPQYVSEWLEIPTFQKQEFFFVTYKRTYKDGRIEKKELKHHDIGIKADDQFLSFTTSNSLDDTLFFVTNPSKGTLGYTLIKRPYCMCQLKRPFLCDQFIPRGCRTENYFTIVHIKNECAQAAWIYPEVMKFDIPYDVVHIYDTVTIDSFKIEHDDVKEFNYHSYSVSFFQKKDFKIVNRPPTPASVTCIVHNAETVHLLSKIVSPVICGAFMHLYYYSLRYTPEGALDLVEANNRYETIGTVPKGVYGQ